MRIRRAQGDDTLSTSHVTSSYKLLETHPTSVLSDGPRRRGVGERIAAVRSGIGAVGDVRTLRPQHAPAVDS